MKSFTFHCTCLDCSPFIAFNPFYAHSLPTLQSHDDYNWTVYTTWQISFKQLTQSIRQGVWRVTQNSISSIHQGALGCVTSPKNLSSSVFLPEPVVLSTKRFWNWREETNLTWEEVGNQEKHHFLALNLHFSNHRQCHFGQKGSWRPREDMERVNCACGAEKIAFSTMSINIWTRRDKNCIRQEAPWRVPKF
jgi:hypothetical protein